MAPSPVLKYQDNTALIRMSRSLLYPDITNCLVLYYYPNHRGHIALKTFYCAIIHSRAACLARTCLHLREMLARPPNGPVWDSFER